MVVVDQQAVLDMLARLHEVDAQLFQVAARTGELRPFDQPHIAVAD